MAFACLDGCIESDADTPMLQMIDRLQPLAVFRLKPRNLAVLVVSEWSYKRLFGSF